MCAASPGRGSIRLSVAPAEPSNHYYVSTQASAAFIFNLRLLVKLRNPYNSKIHRLRWVGIKIQDQQYLMIIFCHKPNANAIVVTFCRHAKSPQLRRSL